jgi:hypothetical protein
MEGEKKIKVRYLANMMKEIEGDVEIEADSEVVEKVKTSE